jgi:hypothetical protein
MANKTAKSPARNGAKKPATKKLNRKQAGEQGRNPQGSGHEKEEEHQSEQGRSKSEAVRSTGRAAVGAPEPGRNPKEQDQGDAYVHSAQHQNGDTPRTGQQQPASFPGDDGFKQSGNN